MKITTTAFGEMEVAEEQIIRFPKGIPGFEQLRTFVLIPADRDAQTPYFFLQSIEETAISLFLADPFTFYPDYDVELPEGAAERLQLEDPADAIVLTTITAAGDISQATTNMKAPLIINNKKQLGAQIVLEKTSCTIKQPLFQTDGQKRGK